MAHRVEIYTTDNKGNVVDVIDAHYYCSDACAKHDPAYDGWNGSIEEVFYPTQCTCGELLPWYRWNYETHDQETVLPTAPDYWDTY